MIVFIRAKLVDGELMGVISLKDDLRDALATVDPALLYTHDTASATHTFDVERTALAAGLKDVPVIRLVVTAVDDEIRRRISFVPNTRPDASVAHDLEIIADRTLFAEFHAKW